MVAKVLDLDLFEELIDHEVLPDNTFADLFKGKERTCVFVENLIDLTKFAFSERFLQLKIINRDFFVAENTAVVFDVFGFKSLSYVFR